MFQRNSHHEYTVQQPFSWLKKAFLVVAISGFIAVIWYAAANRDDLSSEDLNPTLVQAPQSPIKERPESPGGMDVPHRDKKVFNLLEDDTKTAAEATSDSDKDVEQTTTSTSTQPETQDDKSVDTQEEPKTKQAQQAKPDKKEEAEQTEPIDVVTEVRQPSEKTPDPAPAPDPQVDTQKGWAVQLGSFRNRKDAKKAINIFDKKFGTMLEGLTPSIRTAQLEQGTFHRVSYVGLESGEAARNLCSAFKQRNQGCLHVKLK